MIAVSVHTSHSVKIKYFEIDIWSSFKEAEK